MEAVHDASHSSHPVVSSVDPGEVNEVEDCGSAELRDVVHRLSHRSNVQRPDPSPGASPGPQRQRALSDLLLVL